MKKKHHIWGSVPHFSKSKIMIWHFRVTSYRYLSSFDQIFLWMAQTIMFVTGRSSWPPPHNFPLFSPIPLSEGSWEIWPLCHKMIHTVIALLAMFVSLAANCQSAAVSHSFHHTLHLPAYSVVLWAHHSVAEFFNLCSFSHMAYPYTVRMFTVNSTRALLKLNIKYIFFTSYQQLNCGFLHTLR